MSLYNLKSNPSEGLPFIITKFTPDLDVESSYEVGTSTCQCPAGHRPSCRHRQMLPNLRQRVNTAWFWDHSREAWVDPTGEANKPALSDTPDIVDEDQVGPSDNPYSDVVEDQVPGTGPELIEVDEPIARSEPVSPKAESQAAFRRRI